MPDTLSPALLDIFSDFAGLLAESANAVTLAYFRNSVGVDNKLGEGSAFDPVTEADKGAEAAIRKLIETSYPEHEIEGEEFGIKQTGSEFRWVLDPIDGTRAFISGAPSWGTLIALLYQGEPVMGLIEQPALHERYIGTNQGSSLNGKPIKARSCALLTDASVATTDPYLFSDQDRAGFERLYDVTRFTRMGLDCYAYALLSAGHLDIVCETGLAPYDRMALIPVLRGAGASVTDWNGKPAGPSDELLAVSDARLLDPALAKLRP